jgi:class 3 adenylate cyclase
MIARVGRPDLPTGTVTFLFTDVEGSTRLLQGHAMAASALGDHRRALVLAASMEALWESLGIAPSVAFWNALLERYFEAARDALGAGADDAWIEGRALPFEDAIAIALAE